MYIKLDILFLIFSKFRRVNVLKLELKENASYVHRSAVGQLLLADIYVPHIPPPRLALIFILKMKRSE